MELSWVSNPGIFREEIKSLLSKIESDTKVLSSTTTNIGNGLVSFVYILDKEFDITPWAKILYGPLSYSYDFFDELLAEDISNLRSVLIEYTRKMTRNDNVEKCLVRVDKLYNIYLPLVGIGPMKPPTPPTPSERATEIVMMRKDKSGVAIVDDDVETSRYTYTFPDIFVRSTPILDVSKAIGCIPVGNRVYSSAAINFHGVMIMPTRIIDYSRSQIGSNPLHVKDSVTIRGLSLLMSGGEGIDFNTLSGVGEIKVVDRCKGKVERIEGEGKVGETKEIKSDRVALPLEEHLVESGNQENLTLSVHAKLLPSIKEVCSIMGIGCVGRKDSCVIEGTPYTSTVLDSANALYRGETPFMIISPLLGLVPTIRNIILLSYSISDIKDASVLSDLRLHIPLMAVSEIRALITSLKTKVKDFDAYTITESSAGIKVREKYYIVRRDV